jgi:hypothetical protein
MGRTADPNSKRSRILAVYKERHKHFDSRRELSKHISRVTGIDLIYVSSTVSSFAHRNKLFSKSTQAVGMENTKTPVVDTKKMSKVLEFVVDCGSLDVARVHLDALAKILSA